MKITARQAITADKKFSLFANRNRIAFFHRADGFAYWQSDGQLTEAVAISRAPQSR